MCNIREVGNMNSTVNLTKQNGEKIQAEIISYFEIVGTQKRYLFYTLNEAVENGLVKMYVSEVSRKWDIDLSALSNQGKAAKRFDFVIKTDNMIYGIDTNFYGGGGSKLNETARSYKMLSQEADTIEGFTFVWFTDGIGWNSAKGNLRETFDVMDTVYNIDDMENGIMKKILI